MVTAILSQEHSAINSPTLDEADSREEIVIRIGLNGLRGVEIIADQSEAQSNLQQLWDALRCPLEDEMGRLLNDRGFTCMEGRVGATL
ncbi:MAG: hypothetical protein CV081_06180 [Nitrospira sp. LK265]|nr:hypothetical protein [Nitrospira sp.]NGZ60075.1 hypothetical protein [Nitrospira sp. LK265]